MSARTFTLTLGDKVVTGSFTDLDPITQQLDTGGYQFNDAQRQWIVGLFTNQRLHGSGRLDIVDPGATTPVRYCCLGYACVQMPDICYHDPVYGGFRVHDNRKRLYSYFPPTSVVKRMRFADVMGAFTTSILIKVPGIFGRTVDGLVSLNDNDVLIEGIRPHTPWAIIAYIAAFFPEIVFAPPA